MARSWLANELTRVSTPHLQVVSRGVAHEFASVVHRLELHYVNAMIDRRDTKASGSEHWTEATLAETSGTSTYEADVSYWAILNGFFPFDPYQLAKSSSFVDALYVEYQDAATAEEGAMAGIGFRNESDSSEEDELDRLLVSCSMSLSV